MESIIGKEDGERIGIRVTDNNGVDHLIEMEFDGEIKYHEQDGYPDKPDDRTGFERKHFQQAREYARYKIYKEEGYNTLPTRENPDRLSIAAMVIASLSTEEFEAHFGDLYRQLKSHYTDQDPVVDPPTDVGENDIIVYQQDVYLDLSPEAIRSVVEQYDEEALAEYLYEIGDLVDGDTGQAFGALDEMESVASDHGVLDGEGSAEGLIEAVSGVHVKWGDFTGTTRRDAEQPDVEGDPAARLEVIKYDPGTLEEFQQYLVFHLRCQIRDCYIKMGVSPPEPFRVKGSGIHKYTMWYQFYDVDQPYWNPEADIDWENV